MKFINADKMTFVEEVLVIYKNATRTSQKLLEKTKTKKKILIQD
jgi:hypothetical protein